MDTKSYAAATDSLLNAHFGKPAEIAEIPSGTKRSLGEILRDHWEFLGWSWGFLSISWAAGRVYTVKPVLSKRLGKAKKWFLKTGACLIQVHFHLAFKGTTPVASRKVFAHYRLPLIQVWLYMRCLWWSSISLWQAVEESQRWTTKHRYMLRSHRSPSIFTETRWSLLSSREGDRCGEGDHGPFFGGIV